MNHELPWVAERVRVFRESDPEFARWARGHGPITHNDLTQLRVHDLAQVLVAEGKASDTTAVYRTLWSADRLAVAGMWLTVHMTYADRVYPDGREMRAEDFKETPEGHTGGALNIVPAYVGYLAANALSGLTRGWLMGQGHCVAGIDACNLLVGNMTPRHAERYDRSESGLTRFARDFYSYAIDAQGRPASPLGSHVGPNTAGGLSEGGYLGFAELQYVHMPLPGERLVVFLSDGAFEEQRGSDWAPRWWRAEDSGFVAPFMILNGRRIEQRSTIAAAGGPRMVPPASAAERLRPDGDRRHRPRRVRLGRSRDGGAVVGLRGWSFAGAPFSTRYPSTTPSPKRPRDSASPGAGTNAAHNLPLEGNPRVDQIALQQFNEGARALFVPSHELDEAVALLRRHEVQHRPLERDHALAHRQVAAPRLPVPQWHVAGQGEVSPMAALDGAFAALVQANPQLRPRVGNPDELRSNRMGQTLDLLKHRVFTPEPGLAEAVDGAVITALNEEAVVSAALGNKGGINLVVSYEAFAVKMLGALRQEILFARHQAQQAHHPDGCRWSRLRRPTPGRTARTSSRTRIRRWPKRCWAKCPTPSRVLFPVDANSAVAALRAAYASHGQFWTLVVPKRAVASQLSAEQAERLVDQGGWVVKPCDAPDVLLVAIGAYQLQQALLAARRLEAAGHRTAVTCVIEPGRFRAPRDEREQDFVAGDQALRALFPETAAVRVIVSHMRPEPTLGLMRRIDTGARQTRALGYQARGGTLDVAGMLFANRCTWAHVAAEAAQGLGVDPQSLLSAEEWAAVQGRGDPRVITVSA
jgi:phosphoketolase